MTYTYLLLDETREHFVGVVCQDVPWGPLPPLHEVVLPEAYRVRRQGESWEVWTESLDPPPLSEAARVVMAAHAIPLVLPPRAPRAGKAIA